MDYQHLVRDFARRTQHNLELIRECGSNDVEVYEVTQLVNSLLGLLVLPREHYYKSIPATPLEQLRAEGWPAPALDSEFKSPEHLRDLIRLLRNSVAHFHVEFIAPRAEIERVILSNKCNRGNVTWRVSLSLKELDELTNKFANLLLEG